MKLLRLCGLLLLCAWLPSASGQLAAPKVAQVKIEHRGPISVSDELIRANIRVKPGDTYVHGATDDDVRNLYATGFFLNIRVAADQTPQGVVLTYIVQGKPRLVDIKYQGNKRYSISKLSKKVTSKVGEPLDERKLFTDTQEMLKMYQKAGYPHTLVKYSYSIDEPAGRASATFEITESPKVKIIEVDFVGAKAFKQRKLRKVIKTRSHWMFSWITGSGHLKEDEFDDDKEKLTEFYRDNGYIDFELKDVQFLNPSPRTMTIRMAIDEGRQYRVGSIKFSGNQLFTTPDIIRGMRTLNESRGGKIKLGPNGLPMDIGDTFKPKGFTSDIEAVEDFYGARGYIDVTTSSDHLRVLRVPNTETGTMDLEFQINEGQKSFIEKIDIRGNTKTKDKVIRRELAVSPGEAFDMVRVKLSKQRLEGMQYFSKVDARPEPTDMAGRKDLVIAVDEQNTGHMTVGAGFSTVESVVGFAELYQGNFDLFNPPRFTGAGQKFRLRVQLGTQKQDYLASFVEPWFMGHKLSLGVDLYYRDLGYQSLNSIYDEIRAGAKVSLSRTLFGNDFLRGSLSYTLEDVGIVLNSPYHAWYDHATPGNPQPTGSGGRGSGTGPGGSSAGDPSPNIPTAILDEVGYHLLSRLGTSFSYDTRGGGQLPNKGQRTTVSGEMVGGPLGFDKEFYKLELNSAWYFKGFAKGHVLELVARSGVAKSLEAGDVPFYDRYYLGGMWSLRGFKYRSISPRQLGYNEPIGGDTYWFGCAEYSIPIIEQEHGISLRFALFYDIGDVESNPYHYNFGSLSDNWGLGLRINLPIAPIRLDYGIPIHHDIYNGSSGQFQFGVGFTRDL
jgi:outer membrane protein insertion porin family